MESWRLCLTVIGLVTGCAGELDLRLDGGPDSTSGVQAGGRAPDAGTALVPTNPDADIVPPKTDVTSPPTAQPDHGPVAPPTGANSGALCNPAAPSCPNAGEACVYYSDGAAKGLCVLMGCAPDTACSVADPATQLSACFGSMGANHFCAWLCQYQGKAYQCPNATGFACVVLNPAQPDVKYCVPK